MVDGVPAANQRFQDQGCIPPLNLLDCSFSLHTRVHYHGHRALSPSFFNSFASDCGSTRHCTSKIEYRFHCHVVVLTVAALSKAGCCKAF